MSARVRCLTPSALAEWESSPDTAWLRYVAGAGDLVPRPFYEGFTMGSAVDTCMKILRGKPAETSPWPGAEILDDAEPRLPRPILDDVAVAANRVACWYSETPDAARAWWDPTGDRVVCRELELAGAVVRVGGIPDAVTGAGVPLDLKVSTGSGAVLSWSRAAGDIPSSRLARGARSVGEWLTRRQPAWCTAAVMYAWAIHGWRDTVYAEWHQVDASDPYAPALRVLRARLGPTWVRGVARRCRAAWEGLARGPGGAYAGLTAPQLAVFA